MSTLVILLLLLVSLFMLIGVGAAKSDKAVKSQLVEKGTLGVGLVRDYDSDDMVTVDFIPRGSSNSLSAHGRGHFLKKQFPPGFQMAVLYNPLCPAVNSLAPERTDEALELGKT